MSELLERTFRLLAYNVGEGVFTEEEEDIIIELEEQYREGLGVVPADLLWLMQRLKEVGEDG